MGQKQSDLAFWSSSTFWSSSLRDSLECEPCDDPKDVGAFFDSIRTTSLDKPVNKESSQPLQIPETKNKSGTLLPPERAVGSKGEYVGAGVITSGVS